MLEKSCEQELPSAVQALLSNDVPMSRRSELDNQNAEGHQQLTRNLTEEVEEDLANNNDPNNNAANGNDDPDVLPLPSMESSGITVPDDPGVESDVLLILRLISGKSYANVKRRIEAHLNNLARVQVVLNELLEEGDTKNEGLKQPYPKKHLERRLEKNKEGNGLFCKNSNKKRSPTLSNNDGGTSPVGSSGKRKILDLNLEAHCTDLAGFNSSCTLTNAMKIKKVGTDGSISIQQQTVGMCASASSSQTSESSSGKIFVKKEKPKIYLSEQDLHGPFNFFTHRPMKEGKGKQQEQSSSVDKSAIAPLNDDLKKVVDAHGISHLASNSSHGDAVPQRNELPPVVDLDMDSGPVLAVVDSPPLVDISQTDEDIEELFTSLTTMFPDAPKSYLMEQAENVIGKPASINRLINDMLQNGSKPPDYWLAKETLGSFTGEKFRSVQLDARTLSSEEPTAGPSRCPTHNEQLQEVALHPSDKAAANHFPGAVPPALESDEDKANKRLETLLSLFPTVDPEFLHQKAVAFGFHEQSEQLLNEWIDASMDNAHKEFPTRMAYEKRRKEAELLEKYSGQVTVEEILEMYEDPEAYFNDPTRKVSDLYKKHSLNQLKKEFRHLSVNIIIRAYQQNNCLFVPSVRCLCMYKGINGRRKTRRPDHECPLPSEIDLNFLKELRYSRIELDIKKHKLKEIVNKKEQVERAKASGSLVECNCCYNDECLEEDMLPCREGHVFCRDCVQRAAEVAIGDGKMQLMCLGQCNEEFELATLQRALKAVLFSKWLRRIQIAELEKAEIEGLEQCPFCQFATIMDTTPEENKVFSCQDPDCGKESCRLCKEISHIPLCCDEVEKDTEVQKRTYIENKMSEALIRKCWRCKKPFVKLDGCNKMTCDCGAQMCYICRQPVKDYKHFYGQGGIPTKDRACPLFSNSKEVHQREVASTAIEAKNKMDQENPDVKLKHDPTADIQMPEDHPWQSQATNRNIREKHLPPTLEGIIPNDPAERQQFIINQRLIEDQIEQHRFRRQAHNRDPTPNMMNHLFPSEPLHLPPDGEMDWHNGFMYRMGELLQLREAQRQRQRAIRRREQQALEEFQIHRINGPHQNLPAAPPIRAAPVMVQPPLPPPAAHSLHLTAVSSRPAVATPSAPGQGPQPFPLVMIPRQPQANVGTNLFPPTRPQITDYNQCPDHQRFQRHLNQDRPQASAINAMSLNQNLAVHPVRSHPPLPAAPQMMVPQVIKTKQTQAQHRVVPLPNLPCSFRCYHSGVPTEQGLGVQHQDAAMAMRNSLNSNCPVQPHGSQLCQFTSLHPDQPVQRHWQDKSHYPGGFAHHSGKPLESQVMDWHHQQGPKPSHFSHGVSPSSAKKPGWHLMQQQQPQPPLMADLQMQAANWPKGAKPSNNQLVTSGMSRTRLLRSSSLESVVDIGGETSQSVTDLEKNEAMPGPKVLVTTPSGWRHQAQEQQGRSRIQWANVDCLMASNMVQNNPHEGAKVVLMGSKKNEKGRVELMEDTTFDNTALIVSDNAVIKQEYDPSEVLEDDQDEPDPFTEIVDTVMCNIEDDDNVLVNAEAVSTNAVINIDITIPASDDIFLDVIDGGDL